jgi:peptidoglycan LD-endopeptidase LytH
VKQALLLLLFGLALVASFVAMAAVARRDVHTAGPPAEPSSPPPPAAPHPPPAAPVSEAGPLRVVDVPRIERSDLDELRSRSLTIPVAGVKAGDLRDNFAEARGDHSHEALDIIAPRGTQVLAVDDGRVAKLFTSARGGLTVYQFDPAETFCYYYAHLDGYAPGLREGDLLRKGALVGYVGTTGNAPSHAPHLHFTVFKLGPGKRWWEGNPINPFPLWAFAG